MRTMAGRLRADQVLEAMSEVETEDESVFTMTQRAITAIVMTILMLDANSESSSCCDDLDAPPDSSNDETPTNSAQRRGRGRGRGRGCRRGGRGIRGRHSVRGGTAAGRGRAASSSPLYVWTTVGEGIVKKRMQMCKYKLKQAICRTLCKTRNTSIHACTCKYF